ncbi:MAG TPA: sulfotransferase domain-containing protein [Candidatus Eremiobacteraceae bacterium]|nr:sulfotransferase domain-containing protein [Candidatus Eremiobacteraceae bacterium]
MKQVHFDVGGDQRDSVFLAGSGRGGSTWLAEIINYDNAYRFIFEPFNPRTMPLCRAFANRQYLRAGDTRPEFVEAARAIVTGRFRNGWADYHNHRLVNTKRLIKDVRAHLTLRWLYELFPGMPIVLMFRHPCAVAASRLRYGWTNDLTSLLAQSELVEDHLSAMRLPLERLTDPFEMHVAQWCIENYVPLRLFGAGEIHLAFYEDLQRDPRKEIARLFAFVGRPLTEAVFARMAQPSSMAWEAATSITTAGARTDGWKAFVSEDKSHRAIEILNLFGLDRLYSQGPEPLVEAEAVLPGTALSRT